MTPTADRALQVLRRAAGNRPDNDVVLVEVATLLAAIDGMEEHAHCDTASDDALADLQKQHDEELGEITTAAHELIAAVERMVREDYNDVDDAVAALKGML
jgi:hypothetical protein